MQNKQFAYWHLTIYAGIWMLGAFVLLWFNTELWDAIWIVSLLIWGVYWLVGLTILCLALLELFQRQPWKPRVNAIALTLPLLLATMLRGPNLLYPIRLGAVEIPRHYAPEMQRLLALTPEQRTKQAEKNIRLDEGPPVRIAFVQPGGMLDNWSAVVYDPTDLVMKANTVTMKTLHDPKHQDYVKLFGGDLYHVTSLGGHWYLCSFT